MLQLIFTCNPTTPQPHNPHNFSTTPSPVLPLPPSPVGGCLDVQENRTTVEPHADHHRRQLNSAASSRPAAWTGSTTAPRPVAAPRARGRSAPAPAPCCARPLPVTSTVVRVGRTTRTIAATPTARPSRTAEPPHHEPSPWCRLVRLPAETPAFPVPTHRGTRVAPGLPLFQAFTKPCTPTKPLLVSSSITHQEHPQSLGPEYFAQEGVRANCSTLRVSAPLQYSLADFTSIVNENTSR